MIRALQGRRSRQGLWSRSSTFSTFIKVMPVAAALAAGCGDDQPRLRLDAAASNATLQLPYSHTTRLGTGVTLHTMEAGAQEAPVVILLHGFPDSWQVWEPVIPSLAARYRVVAMDLRGHGESDKPACCYAQSDFAADVRAFMDASGIERATVVGHSLGGFVAHRFAIDYPDRLDRLVLVGATAACDNEICGEARALATGVGEPVDTETISGWQRLSFYGEPDPNTFDRIMQQSMKVPGYVWRGTMLALVEENHAADLAAVRAPTMVFAGEFDVFPRADFEKLRSLIPGARLTVYAQTGHFLQVEQPSRFARDLLAFLLTTDRTAGRREADGSVGVRHPAG